jgi:hypothetical protein
VILARNPLKVDAATIKDIQVVETIKEGRTIFRRDATVGAARVPVGAGLPCPHELVGAHGGERQLSAQAQGTLALLEGAARGSGEP